MIDGGICTRAISGGITAKKEGERRAGEEAARQRSRAIVDAVNLRNVETTRQAGREARERRLKKEREDAAAATRVEEQNALEQQEQTARAEQLRGQVDPEILAGLGDTSGLSTADQITAFQDALKRQRAAVRDTREHGQAVELRGTPTGNARTPQDPVAARNDRIRKAATSIMEGGGTFEEALFKAAQREESFEEFTALGLTTDQIIAVDEAAQDILDGKLSFGALQAQVPPNVLEAIQTRFQQLQAEQR